MGDHCQQVAQGVAKQDELLLIFRVSVQVDLVKTDSIERCLQLGHDWFDQTCSDLWNPLGIALVKSESTSFDCLQEDQDCGAGLLGNLQGVTHDHRL